MLAKENRISLDKEFDRVFKTGQSFYAKVIGIKTALNDLKYARFGILVGLKVSKKAVIRNKARRQIRSILGQELPSLKTGKDVIIIVLPPILDKNFKEIKEILISGLKKLDLYK